MSLLALPLDVQRLLFNHYLHDEDALVARCACRALCALVQRARIDACRHRLYEHFCAHGYVALLAWLARQPLRESYAGSLCDKAVKGGHLAVLQWLRANGAPWNTLTCAYAAQGGHFVLLQWLRANGAPWHEQTCARAAAGGHLAMLQWLRANGAPWDKQACAYAAAGGHLAVLQWLHANGASWDKRACTYAARGGHLSVLEWSRLLAGERLCAQMAHPGTSRHAHPRRSAAISRCSSGHAPTARPSLHVALYLYRVQHNTVLYRNHILCVQIRAAV